MNIKPMLAEDWDEKKVKFPVEVQPKVDGMRALNMTGALTGRSRKPFKNKHITAMYSTDLFKGLDGEMHCGAENLPDLCRRTTSALNTIQGQPDVRWMIFDYLTPETISLGYTYRHQALVRRVVEIAHPSLWVVPSYTVGNMQDLLALEKEWTDNKFEGACYRDPYGLHKEGRSSPTQGGLLRIKRFIEEDAIVTGIREGNRNENEATTDLLGRTERSSHQENMVPNGMVGALECIEVKTGMPILVSAAEMSHEDRLRFFQHPELILQKRIKFKHLPTGRKDLPRFPTYRYIIDTVDIV